MTIAFRSAAATNNTSGTTITLNAPSGVAAGDVLSALVMATGSGNPAITSSPSGWVLCDSVNINANTSAFTYRKVAGASEPGSYSWTADRALTTAYSSGCIAAHSGGGGIGGGHGGQNNGSSTSVTAPSILPGADSGVLVFLGVIANTGGFTAPSGMTEQLDVAVGTASVGRVTVADVAIASASATGSVHATFSNFGVNAGFLLAITPQSLGAPLFFGSL